MKESTRYPCILLAIFAVVLAWSAIRPHDYFTWFLEVVPALIALVALAVTYRRFRFSNLVYTLVLIHAIILMVGGKYTYALNPAFGWLQDVLDLQRNYYDRLGHFAQGFVPALVLREIIVRCDIIRGRGWQFVFIVMTCLGFSAVYELFEWFTAVALGSRATDFLGTQGDVWDTQWDMFLALLGATLALCALRNIHDRSIARVE